MNGLLRYREAPMPPRLADYAVCCWAIEGCVGASAVRHRVLPDGCADLLVDLGAGSPLVQLVGTMTQPILVVFAGRVDLFGIRFRPGGARPLWKLGMEQLTDRLLAADGLDTLDHAALVERLAAASGFDARVRTARDWLSRQLCGAAAPDARLRQALRLFVDRPATPLAQAAAALGTSPRQLERRFRDGIGTSPRTWRRYLRFRRAVSLAGAATGTVDWADVAAASGFCDQAHLSREFRRFSGLSPTAWQREQRVASIQDTGEARGG